ncbi:MAG TPA: hypothetical protein PK447_07090 [Ignavibacteria bacterium]|nr:hypothetical protein [Ignavibacteria bacterium]
MKSKEHSLRQISEVDKIITKNVKKILKKNNYKPADLAREISYVNNEPYMNVKSALSNYLNHYARWNALYLNCISYILGVSLDELFGKDTNPKHNTKALEEKLAEKNRKIIDLEIKLKSIKEFIISQTN